MAKIINPIAKNEKTLRLEEMLEAMNGSIDNVETVIKQQQLLIEVVEASDKKDSFEEFIKESKEQVEHLEAQRTQMLERQEKVAKVLECMKDSEKADVILLTFDAFGIFE